MNLLKTLFVIILTLLWISGLNADIYSWTDKKGVKHFGNQPPPEAENAVVIFKEYKYDKKADQRRVQIEQEEWQDLIKEIEVEDERAKAEERKKAEEARRNRKPTKEEIIAAEKERLENKIAELEEKPLDYFGSFDNKRIRLGFYRYQLETLMQNPDKYFRKPEKFEGNVKYPENDSRSY